MLNNTLSIVLSSAAAIKYKCKNRSRDLQHHSIMMLTLVYSICMSMLLSIGASFLRSLPLDHSISRKFFSRVNSAKSAIDARYSNKSTSSELQRTSNNENFISLRSYGQKSILPFSRQNVIPCIILAAATKAVKKANAQIPFAPVTDDSTVIKRQSDSREYLPLTLSNGMRILLISDKTTVRSAAAMDVHVGSFSDPKDLQGLAHFTEHMSFLGTKKYPKEGDFTDFLSTHGGNSNAYTANEDTVYYFDVNAEFFQQALDRFAEFFIAPLFTASATERELNAIESEHSKNINNDGFRLYQLERDMANPQHPFSQFSTGNLATLRNEPMKLGIDTRQRLLDFHRQYYSAPLMTLCVLGKESLQDMKRWVESQFAPVPDRNVASPALSWWGSVSPYVEMLNREVKIPLLQVVPASEGMNYLTLSWVRWVRSPEERQQLREGNPSFVVAHLLGHESAGSLRSLLVRRGWTNAVSAEVSNDDSDLQQFDVHVDLTEEGFKHTNEIISIIFAYLRMVSRSGVPDYIFQELEQLSQINFDYAEKAEVSDYVTTVAASMQEFPSPRQYLTGGRIFYPQLCKPLLSAFVDDLLLSLQPLGADREVRETICRVKVVSRNFADKTTEIAPYYGTKYNQIEVDEKTLRTWNSEKLVEQALHLPAPNPFIPGDFTLLTGAAQTLNSAASSTSPVLLRRDDSWTLWYELDRIFQQPKVHLIVSLSLPRNLFEDNGDLLRSAIFITNAKLFSMCLQQSSLNEQLLYDAGLAGLNFNFDLTSKGLQLVVSGFSDKLPLFVERVCSAIREYTPDVQTFTRVKELMRRELSSWETQQPYVHCAYYAGLVSESLQFTIQDMRAALGMVTLDMQAGFLRKLFQEGSYGTALIVGNADESGAKKLLGIVERSFPLTSLPIKERATKRVVLYPTGILGARISRNEPNAADVNSACTFYFQLPSVVAADYMPLELLAEVAQQPFYNSLRTQQQLGYIVFCGVKVREGGVHYLTFTVQSSVVNGYRITELIETFLKTELLPIVEKLDNQTLQDFKNGIIVRKLEADKRLSQRATRFWSEIVASLSRGDGAEPQFNRAALEVEGLKKLELQNFKQFARNLLEEGSMGRRLLISQVTATTATTAGDGNTTSNRYSEVGDEIPYVKTQPFI